MDRRTFLKGLVATAAGVLVPAEVLAEPERRIWALDSSHLSRGPVILIRDAWPINSPITMTNMYLDPSGGGPVISTAEHRADNEPVVISDFWLEANRGDYGIIDGKDSYVVMDGVTYYPSLINQTYVLRPEMVVGARR